MKIAKNHPSADAFAFQSGKLIQNFGFVELMTYEWIALLSDSTITDEIVLDAELSERIKKVLTLLKNNTSIAIIDCNTAKKLWHQILDYGCELRNAVCHGCVALSFPNNDKTMEPYIIGILKIRKRQNTDQILSLQELRGAVNSTAKIVEELNSIFENYKKAE